MAKPKKRKGTPRPKRVQRVVTVTRTERAVFQGFEEEVDNVFRASDDGDCSRAWKHLERAERSAGDSPTQNRTLDRLQRQLSARCPTGARGDESARMGAIGNLFGLGFWALLGVGAGLAYVTFAKPQGNLNRDEIVQAPGVIRGRVISSQEVA